MITFWILVAVMLLGAVLMLSPVWRKPKAVEDTDRDKQNISIAREHLQELEAGLTNGEMTQAEFEQRRRELELALVVDLETQESAGSVASTWQGKRTLIMITALVPLISIGLYLKLGSIEVINRVEQTVSSAGAQKNVPSIDALVERLAVRLQQNPDDIQGWRMLGRSYMLLKRYDEAATAMQHLHALVGDNVEVLLSYADALAMASGGRLSGKPAELIQKALALEPDNLTGLWLAGMAAQEQGQDQLAISYWKKVLPRVQDQPESSERLRNLIANASSRLEQSPELAEVKQPGAATAVAGNKVTVEVSLSQELANRVAPTDTLFVYARALQGPPMPLAVQRKQVKDLPLTVTLDDSMAMIKTMKLSNFAQVQVGARISKSGNATPQSGDLSSERVTVKTVDNSVVQLLIDQTLP